MLALVLPTAAALAWAPGPALLRSNARTPWPSVCRAPTPHADAERQAPRATSLIPEVLKEMEADPQVGVRPTARERMEERRRRRRALNAIGVPKFARFVEQQTGEALLRKRSITILQVNVGLFCNMACTHCHVESSPRRKEALSAEHVDHILALLAASPECRTLDITGGAPEFHPDFRRLVSGARALGVEVIDRCNLTVLLEPGMEWAAPFLAAERVRVVASLPCYSAENVDKQRGNQVFDRSIRALQKLNALGFGREASGLQLDLVYNPGGAFLPPSQSMLRDAYARELDSHFGVTFNELFTITNMPIKRFADSLARDGKLEEYMQLLVDSFNPATLEDMMCRSLLSVGYDGTMYDCDFNYALEMPHGLGRPITSITSLESLHDKPITTGSHCFGCTAGAGSS